MKTLFKILRSTFTSFLFIILTLGIAIQIIFTITNTDIKKFKDLIKPDLILEKLSNDLAFDNDNIKDIVIEYIDGYIDYIFSKRSYPSIQTLDTKNLSEEEKLVAEQVLLELQKETELDYEVIAKIRDVSNILTNKSIFLMINIGVFLLFLILTICSMDFKRSLKSLSLSISLSGFIVILFASLLSSKIDSLADPFMKTILTCIYSGNLKSIIYRNACIYILLGIILFFVIFILNKTLEKRQILTK